MKSIVLCDDGKPEKVLPLCEKYNFGIEIQGFYNPNEIGKRNELLTSYRGILPQGIHTYLHAPFWDLSLGSANEKIVEVTKFYFDYAYSLATELNCLGITVHHGFVPNTSYPENWIKRSVVFWQDFLNTHAGNTIMFMENQCEQNPETLIGIVDSVKNSRLYVNLDIGHAHCNSNLAVTEWIKRLGHRVKYVHLHQNNGITDEHLSLTKGNIPMKDILEALDAYAPEAVWALECHVDCMEDSIAVLNRYGYLK